ncbi:uncharacterized protein LOC112092450 [Morus notabilis]|uniref:uncharacterized protein LOC112092450 n=1 Tax=Morus notabilis TaxID=981085 RepID=UPI000CED1CCA|nr:uncharacterized protein LOC112092450 [Morus notabilis]XP_024024430.1 uncharacterized protein LOC112092450 [Morus notabilis]XP_024024431.1 uncharacterized protein LOC112092450 [Morus notabilis]
MDCNSQYPIHVIFVEAATQTMNAKQVTKSHLVHFLSRHTFLSNFHRQNNPYSNTYKLGWRNHPNFAWNQNNVKQPPPGFPPQEKKSNLEDMMAKFLSTAETRVQNQEASIQNLKVQIGQLANLVSRRTQGSLPSNTEKNPKEQVKAMALRSGKQLDEPTTKVTESNIQEDSTIIEEKEETTTQEERLNLNKKSKEKGVKNSDLTSEKYMPHLPYPQRLKQDKLDKHFSKFLEIFKKLQINIPFAEALSQMPSYAKFLKEILSNKRRLEERGTIMLTEECSAIPQNKKLGLGKVKATTVSLQLADRSIKRPWGIIEDVLVKVDKFIFPMDFIVLDMEED